MPRRERCPKCGSDDIRGGAADTSGGDELQDRYCHHCRYLESRLRSEGGVSWYTDVLLAPPHRMHAAGGIERTLLDAIDAAPDDDAPRSVYADWLIERGDPLGTFIALQLDRARRHDPAVSAEEQALVAASWGSWIGEASALFEADAVAFERGFWSAARIRRPAELDAAARHVTPVPVAELVVYCGPDEARSWIDVAAARGIPNLTLVTTRAEREAYAALEQRRCYARPAP